MGNVIEKIENYEKQGYEYLTNYRTQNHVLNECLIKDGEILEITNGEIKSYNKRCAWCNNFITECTSEEVINGVSYSEDYCSECWHHQIKPLGDY